MINSRKSIIPTLMSESNILHMKIKPRSNLNCRKIDFNMPLHKFINRIKNRIIVNWFVFEEVVDNGRNYLKVVDAVYQ